MQSNYFSFFFYTDAIDNDKETAIERYWKK
jgi:hypothetical protein